MGVVSDGFSESVRNSLSTVEWVLGSRFSVQSSCTGWSWWQGKVGRSWEDVVAWVQVVVVSGQGGEWPEMSKTRGAGEFKQVARLL